MGKNRLKTYQIIIVLTIGLIFLLEILAVIYKPMAKFETPVLNDISEVVNTLKNSTTLKVHNSFHEHYFYGVKLTRDYVIDNPKLIDRLVTIVNDTESGLSWRGFPAHWDRNEFVDIYMYRNEAIMGWFRVNIDGYLKIGEPSKPVFYKYSDQYLLDRIREAIGAEGDSLGRKFFRMDI